MLLSLFALALAVQETPPAEPEFGRPEWLSKPTRADLTDAYPVSAYETGKGGTVTMICRATAMGDLDRCEVIKDTNPEAGFAGPSLKLTRLYKMKAVGPDGAPVTGRLVRVPIVWTAPGKFAADGLPYDLIPLERLTWTGRVRPTKTIGETRTLRLVCRISVTGKLTPCAEPGSRKAYDGPAKWTARKFTAAPLDVDGKPTRGKLVVLEFPDVTSKLP
ncbi:hypothetical protein [Caulobacter sp. NIBR1757]|uniref:hypothetical protein n=1 Tax=Caulobacter sp. NIBR1757 TaxID=3016000 RepID=UPI0022EFFE3E|nr:hypothetical protein [Caulobacter sp. NIBR1757]WGM40191.1 hypothetical protein AMEJIAPC_03132 [Caulobacter sp. NIBR1757]